MSSEPDLKTCPDCAEDVKARAVKCRYCGYRWEAEKEDDDRSDDDSSKDAVVDEGWFPDPEFADSGYQRWWDGVRWTLVARSTETLTVEVLTPKNAGWYPDPTVLEDVSAERFWNGSRWTKSRSGGKVTALSPWPFRLKVMAGVLVLCLSGAIAIDTYQMRHLSTSEVAEMLDSSATARSNYFQGEYGSFTCREDDRPSDSYVCSLSDKSYGYTVILKDDCFVGHGGFEGVKGCRGDSRPSDAKKKDSTSNSVRVE